MTSYGDNLYCKTLNSSGTILPTLTGPEPNGTATVVGPTPVGFAPVWYNPTTKAMVYGVVGTSP
jgi:hypothetical protein